MAGVKYRVKPWNLSAHPSPTSPHPIGPFLAEISPQVYVYVITWYANGSVPHNVACALGFAAS